MDDATPVYIMKNNTEILNTKINDLSVPCPNIGEIASAELSDKQPTQKSAIRKRRRARLTLIPRKSSKTYSCTQCTAVFSRQSLLKSHESTHVDCKNEDLQCEECKVCFSSSTKLLRHKQVAHGFVLKCHLCGNAFAHITSYKIHMRIHVGEKPYACNECDAKFTQSSHLNIHKRTHTGEKPYQCGKCQKGFKQISHLRAHERIHTQSKPFSCTSCGAAFIQKSSLVRHIRTHTGERPYSCHICKASFCVRNNLNRHMQMHSGEHPFECYCGAKFSAEVDLNRHMMAHKGLKPYSCDTCTATFSRKANLKWHQLTHTGETPLQCNKCPAQFMKPRDLRKHKNIHEATTCILSTECEETFSKNSGLICHSPLKKSEQRTSCDVCGKSFSTPSCLRRHRLLHFKVIDRCKACQVTLENSEAILEHNKVCGKENRLQTKVGEKDIPNTTYEQIVHQISQPVSYLQVQNLSTIPVQNTMPCAAISNVSSLTHNYVHDSNGYLTVTSQGPALIWGVQNESMIVARPALNCPNTSNHIFVVGSNSQLESWCFCDQTTTLPGSPSVTAVEVVATPNRAVECVQLQQKYVPTQSYPPELERRNIQQPILLAPTIITNVTAV